MISKMNQKQGGARSRLGCLTCRRRHKKCDEKRPACQACQKSGRECEYGSDLKWATVGDSASLVNMYKKPKRASKTREKPIPREVHDTAEQRRPSPALNSDLATPVLQILDAESGDPFSSRLADFDFDMFSPSALDVSSWDNDMFGHEPTPLTNQLFELDVPGEQTPLLHEAEQESFHCTGTQVNREIFAIPPPPMTIQHSGLSLFLSSSISCPSEETAFTYYIHHETVRIPAYDSRQNPYRKLSAIALSYPLLLQTIVHVSTVSMFNHGKSTSDLITKHQSQAWESLQDAFSCIQTDNEPDAACESRSSNLSLSILSAKEVTLAAFLMFIASEVMSGSHNAETYLQSAYKIMESLGYIECMPGAFYSRFLVERFAIIDIVLSFLRHQKPIAPPGFVLYQPNEEADEFEPPFRELTGCPQAVLVFLARISYLAGGAVTRESWTPSYLQEAYQLETELRGWGQRNFDPFTTRAGLDGVGSPVQDVRKHLDTLSECFYWTALLLLMRRVFLDATRSPRVQFVRKRLFDLMDRLPLGCGPDSSLPFPFYMAAREAIDDKDRKWVRRRHSDMMHFYRDKARQIMMELTEQIWLKADDEIAWADQDLRAGFGRKGSDMDIHALDATASHLVF